MGDLLILIKGYCKSCNEYANNHGGFEVGINWVSEYLSVMRFRKIAAFGKAVQEIGELHS